MSNKCDCEACTIREKYNNPAKKSANISRFKENIAQITPLSASFSIEKESKNGHDHVYRINISELCKFDGTFVEYSKDIDNFEFSMLMDEFFDIDSDEEDDFDVDEPGFEGEIQVFNNLNEVIDYLQQNKKEDDQ
jgi:hypothetical protein